MNLSFPREHSRQTKRKTNAFPPPGFQLFPADLTASPPPSWLPRKLHDPKTRAFMHSQCFPERVNQTPEAEPYTRSQTESPKTNPCLNPQHTSEHNPMPDAAAICPDLQSISEATNKRAPGSYLNKGSIPRVWRAEPFSTFSSTNGNSSCASALAYNKRNYSMPSRTN